MTHRTASPFRHFDRSPGLRPGRSGEIWRARRRRPRSQRSAGLRRWPDFSARYASVEMTGGRCGRPSKRPSRRTPAGAGYGNISCQSVKNINTDRSVQFGDGAEKRRKTAGNGCGGGENSGTGNQKQRGSRPAAVATGCSTVPAFAPPPPRFGRGTGYAARGVPFRRPLHRGPPIDRAAASPYFPASILPTRAPGFVSGRHGLSGQGPAQEQRQHRCGPAFRPPPPGHGAYR